MAELTWPQLMHAMGIDAEAAAEDAERLLIARQDEVFDEIVARRGCLPVELLRIPAGDWVELVRGEGRPSGIGVVLASLRRYVDGRAGQ